MAPNPPAELDVRLAGLWIYPIKSCAGVAVESAAITAQGGLEGDREWAVIDEDSVMVWQGGIPRLALIRPQLRPDGLWLHATGAPALRVDSSIPGGTRAVKIWHEGKRDFETYSGHGGDPEADAWLSAFLGRSLRLVRLGDSARQRPTLSPLHLLTPGSLAELNRKLQEQGHVPVSLERFRPNLLIDCPAGMLPPFAEEKFSRLHWPLAAGAMHLQITDPCVRCIMTNIDQNDARVGKEPLATIVRLSRERRGADSVLFGVYARATSGGTLRQGAIGRASFV